MTNEEVLEKSGTLKEMIAILQIRDQLYELSKWMRKPGNIDIDDARDQCARAVRNYADSLNRLANDKFNEAREAESVVESS